MINASDCKCVVCGKQAVAFWPIIDPDIPEHPYCRKCLTEAQAKVIASAMGVPEKIAKQLLKKHKVDRQGL